MYITIKEFYEDGVHVDNQDPFMVVRSVQYYAGEEGSVGIHTILYEVEEDEDAQGQDKPAADDLGTPGPGYVPGS